MIELDMPFVLFKDRGQLPATSGVYVVTNEETVFYVGRARNLNQRWRRHHRELQMRNHYRIYWRDCAREELDFIEGGLTARLRPTLNSTQVERLSQVDIPLTTQNQIRALMLDLDEDARSVVILAIAQLWQREIGEPDRDVLAELDEVKRRLDELSAA